MGHGDVDVVGAQNQMNHYPKALSVMTSPEPGDLADPHRKRTGRADDYLDLRLARAGTSCVSSTATPTWWSTKTSACYEQFKSYLAQHQLSWRFSEVIRMLLSEE
jgi:hypothetical protein